MRVEKPDYETAIEGLLSSIEVIETWEREPSGDGGTDYRVFAADGHTATDAAAAVEMEPVPGGHPITISSATDEWFWVGVRPRDND